MKELLSTPQGFRAFVRIVEALAFVAVFAIMIFEVVPLSISNTNATLRYATLQQSISQRIAKDALLLQYGTSSDKVQSISELQNMLPTWESDQRNLQNGNLPILSQTLLVSSNTNYVSIDMAVRAILQNPQTVDVAQLQIIKMQERPYFIAVSQIANELQQQVYNSLYMRIIIIEVTCVILLAIKTTFVFIIEVTVRRYLKEQGK